MSTLRSFAIILVLLLTSCSVKYYHRSDLFPYPHGDVEYAEIQLRDDGTYREYVYERSEGYTGMVFTSNWIRRGDTIVLTGYDWEFRAADSTWIILDSSIEISRVFAGRKELLVTPASRLYSFDVPGFTYDRGKSHKLRRLEKRDSIQWLDMGNLGHPAGDQFTSTGLRD